MVAYKAQRFSLIAEKVVHYDDERVRTDGNEPGQHGKSFNTRNIGVIVALKANNSENDGVIVATTHLFWHPKYAAHYKINTCDSDIVLDILMKGLGRNFGSPFKSCC